MGDVARTDETFEYGGVLNPAALVFGTCEYEDAKNAFARAFGRHP
jgi:hypothetical protein